MKMQSLLRGALWLGGVMLMLGLAACGSTEEIQTEAFDILRMAEPVPTLITQALTAHSALQTADDEKLSLQSSQLDIGDLNIYTLTAEDFKGYPFTNINFVAPREIGSNIWDFAATLKGNEWTPDDFHSGWAMVLTGATDVRDTLISVNPGLNYLLKMRDTLTALGGPSKFVKVVASDSQNFLLQDKGGSYWSVDEKRKLTATEVQSVKDMYEEIYSNINNSESAKRLQTDWQKLTDQSAKQQRALGYSLTDFANQDGTLNLQAAQTARNSTLSTQWAKHEDACWLFICSVVEWGEIGNSRNQVPSTRQRGGAIRPYGGYKQKYEDYFGGSSNLFPTMIGCGNNVRVSASLGCGPSAFQGLLQHQFQEHGKTFAGLNKRNTTPENFDKWLVAPVGYKNRPRIANYMGTCKPPFTTESLTTAGAFLKGANDFLSDAKSDLKLIGTYSSSEGQGNTKNAPAKARLIVQELGYKENPMVVEYFRNLPTSGHFSAIKAYRNTWQVNVTVTVTTVDDPGHYYSLDTIWSLQTGVFALVQK